MSLRSLESAILAEARVALNNKKLRLKDLAEWSSGEISVGDGEMVLKLPNSIWIAVDKSHDKRKPSDA
jgi:hypothetical protein